MKLDKPLIEFYSHQEKRLSSLRTQLGQQQDGMISKINLLWKAIFEKLDNTPIRDTAGNPRAQMNFTSSRKKLKMKSKKKRKIARNTLTLSYYERIKVSQMAFEKPRPPWVKAKSQGANVFVGNFTYDCDFMVLVDTTSVIDHDLGAIQSLISMKAKRNKGEVTQGRVTSSLATRLVNKEKRFLGDSQMHNNIMATGSRDRPPMLPPGRYPQWRSRFLRCVDTRPNGEALRKCILSGPYKPTTVLVQAVEATDNSLAVPEHTTVETPTNMSPENKAHFLAEKEAIHLILTGIGDDIYSTVDAFQTAQEMWEAISHTTTRHKGNEIANPITPPSKTASEEDSDPEQAQRDKDMQKNLALIAKYFKKIYKPTNNNLRTSSNSKNKNVDTNPWYRNDSQFGQFGNQRTVNVAAARGKPKRVKDFAYHKENMLLYKQAEQGVPLQAEQYDWLADTDEEVDEQELEAHYSYMAKIQEVPTANSSTNSEPLEQVQTDAGYNVFDNDLQHFKQFESNNQNDVEIDDERVMLANLIANLKLDVDENKKIQKQLKKANATLAQELTECKAFLAKTSKSLGESISVRDSCLVALQTMLTEFEKYKAFNDCTIDYDKLELKLKEALGQIAHKDTVIREGLKTKAYELSVVKEKHDELMKHSLLTKSHYEGLVKQKTKVIMDLKLREEHNIEKILSMEKQLKFLNEVVYKKSQSIQTIHMMAPKVPTYNGRPTFANPRYLKQAQFEILCLYAFPYDQNTHANRLIPDGEETLALEKESRSKLNKDSQEIYADLKYVKSLEKEIDKRESDKAVFSNMYDVILQECVSKDVMCSYLQSLFDLDALAELQCMYLQKVKECDYLAQKLSNQTESAKNDTVWNEKASNGFRKEREQYIKIQDLKAKLQDKNIAISELKKLIEKGNRKSVDTKFNKSSIVRQPNAQRIPKPSVLGKPTPFSDSLERRYFPKTRSISKTNVSEGIKRRRLDLYGDGVRNLMMASGRGRLKEDLESSTWQWRQDFKATPS
nr:hypothetical protein [Tanacetum cinerariifolium]